MGLDSLLKEIRKYHAHESQQSKKRRKVFDALKESIIKGDSTGNKVDDFLLIVANLLPGEQGQYSYMRERLTNLETSVNSNNGQQVLVLTDEQHISGCTGFGHPGFLSTTSYMMFSVIKGALKFDYSNPQIIIPTDRVVMYDPRDGDMGLAKTDIAIDSMKLLGLGNHIDIQGPEEFDGKFESLKKALNVLAGNAEVELFFSMGRLFYDDLRNIKPEKREGYIEAVKNEQSGSKNLVYIKLCKKLGLTPPQEFLGTQAALGVEAIQKLIGADFKLYQKDPSQITRDDTAEVRSVLQEVLKYDAHKLDKTVEMKPGVTINVAKYVAGLCEKYGTKMPE